jgi:hypothetical protein
MLEKIWHDYPESHLHCDVTIAGLHSYGIVASLLNRNGDVIATVDHYGSGDLNTLKEQAFRLLTAELYSTVEV